MVLATATIPLVLAILALYRNRTGKTTDPLETLSMTILNIKRFPVEDHLWKKLKSKNSSNFIIIICVLIFVVPILEFTGIFGIYTAKHYSALDIIVFLLLIANIILAIIYIRLFRNSYMFRSHSANQGRYAIFKEAQILIKSDYLYLFNKCHEILKVMGTQVIEVDNYTHFLEAFTPGTILNRARSIEVRVQAIEGKEGIYSVLVKASPYVKRENKDQISVSSVGSSKVVNRFINHLISTTDGADKKTQKEMEPA
jgi:hypothetical protein